MCLGSGSGYGVFLKVGSRFFAIFSLQFEITGNGDVLEPADNVLSIGSGSPYAIGLL